MLFLSKIFKKYLNLGEMDKSEISMFVLLCLCSMFGGKTRDIISPCATET